MKLFKKHITARGAKSAMNFANALRYILIILLIISATTFEVLAQKMESSTDEKKTEKSVISQTPFKGGQNPLDQYLREAAQNNPGLKAQFQQYLSALQQIPQVNTLPDPELFFGYFISPIETRVGPQQARFGLTQMFPWFGTLGAKGEAASQMVKAKFEAFQVSRNQLFYQVHKQWYKLYQIDQSIQILQENIEILETFESLATQRYENNQVGQVDVLRVQIEKEDLKTRLELLNDNKTVAIQAFNELLNRSEENSIVIADTLKSQHLAMSKADIEQAVLHRNPNLAKIDFQASSARSSIKAARKEGLPKFGLGLDYVVTDERNMAMPNNGQDAIMARVGIQIPLYRKKYQAKEQQARIELNAVQNRRSSVENHLQTKLEQALRNYKNAQRRIVLYKDVQIQRTRQAIDILTQQYATGHTDFEELLRLQRKQLDYELAQVKALVDQNSAVAQIEYLYGKYNISPEEIETKYGRD